MKDSIKNQSVKVAVAGLFLVLLAFPFDHANASPDSVESTLEKKTPKVSAAPGKPHGVEAQSMPQTAIKNPGTTSTDFLMGTSPLQKSKPGAPEPGALNFASPVDTPRISPLSLEPGAVTSTIPAALNAATQRLDDVALLVSESCSQGSAADGEVVTCDQVYSNGHHARIITQKSSEGDEHKLQTVIEEFDRDDQLFFKKTIRHRVDYNYYQDKKGTEKELVDIIYQTAGQKTVRELMVHQYYLDTGKMKSLSWAQYEQIGDSETAGLVYNAALHYTSDGTPLRGTAERWEQGQKMAVYMEWDATTHDRIAFDKEHWHEWESWILSASLHAYIP